MLVAAFLAPVAQQFVSDGVSLISQRPARCRRRSDGARALRLSSPAALRHQVKPATQRNVYFLISYQPNHIFSSGSIAGP